MTCEPFKPLIAGYVDEELSAEDRRRLEKHLAGCEACARERDELLRLKEELAMMKFREPSDDELERYWSGVYNRLERGVGWVLLSAGSILLLCYGAFRLIEELIRDPAVSWILKVGVCAAIAGLVILFVSLLRERLALRKLDRYAKEIER